MLLLLFLLPLLLRQVFRVMPHSATSQVRFVNVRLDVPQAEAKIMALLPSPLYREQQQHQEKVKEEITTG